MATSAFETALAVQLGTLEAGPLPPTPASSDPDVPTASVAYTPALAPADDAGPNPWADSIPTAACIPADIPQTGRVVEIVNGDMIKVLMDSDARVHSVRYLGVLAPDSGGVAELQAVARNTELAFHRQVILVRDITDADANGILLRYVLAEDVFINHELVAGGIARAHFAAPDTACLASLQAAEDLARAAGLGMWSPGATPP